MRNMPGRALTEVDPMRNMPGRALTGGRRMRSTLGRCGLALALALAVAPANGAFAQVTELLPGSAVRIAGRISGTLTRATADTLFLLSDAGARLAMPRASLTTIEISGPPNRGVGAVRGALLGGGGCAALGLLFWLGGAETETENPWTGKVQEGVAGPLDVLLLGGIGAGLGAVLGGVYLAPRQWRTVEVGPAQVSVRVLPAGRAAVAVSLR